MGIFATVMGFLAKPGAATLVGAGSSALSTYAQSRNAQKMANQGTDLGKLRREAEANGFNPLTVLRATGGQGFKQNVSLGSGALASAAFFNSFAGLGQNIAQAKQQEATLKNTLASTRSYTARSQPLGTAATTIPSDISPLMEAPRIEVSQLPDGTKVNSRVNALLQTSVDGQGRQITTPAGEDISEWALNLAKIAVIVGRDDLVPALSSSIDSSLDNMFETKTVPSGGRNTTRSGYVVPPLQLPTKQRGRNARFNNGL
jgi:hypothetical protein